MLSGSRVLVSGLALSSFPGSNFYNAFDIVFVVGAIIELVLYLWIQNSYIYIYIKTKDKYYKFEENMDTLYKLLLLITYIMFLLSASAFKRDLGYLKKTAWAVQNVLM